MKYWSTVCVFVAVCLQMSDGASVLFFLGVSTYSHRILISPLAEKMADRGDQVTIFCPLPAKTSHPNVTEFFPQVFRDIGSEVSNLDFIALRIKDGRLGSIRSATDLPALGLGMCKNLLNAPETQQLLTENFDLIVVDSLFNECAYGLAHKIGAKTILFGTSTLLAWWYDAFGFLPETSWLSSEIFVAFAYPMNFGERILNTLMPLILHAYRLAQYYPALEEMLRTQLNMPDMPPLHQLVSSTSLVLLDAHFSEEEARSMPPFIIPVSGLHISKVKENSIPKEVLEFIEGGGKEGFVYVSFGSGAKISNAPTAVRKIFYDAFRNAKIRFLWKWEGPRPSEMPSNVFTADWLPQQQILAKGPRAFITHGGVLSIQEATAHGIPVIVFPIFADQDYTAFRVARNGRGITLELSSITLEVLELALNEILTNTTYKKNMEKAGNLFRDRSRPALDEALWWVDYVLRHKDTNHLHPLGRHQSWILRRSLDVWFFIFLLFFVLVYSIKRSLCFIFVNRMHKKAKKE